jgi:general stress protein 26
VMISDELQALQDRSFARAQTTTRGAYPPERRMSGATLESLLVLRKYILVSTVRRSGRPHLAPSSFVWFEGRVWLPTESGAARVANVRAAPYVSLALHEGEESDHAAVLIEGPAELISTQDAPPDPERLWHRKFSHLPEWADVWIAVAPVRLFSYAAEDWAAP